MADIHGTEERDEPGAATASPRHAPLGGNGRTSPISSVDADLLAALEADRSGEPLRPIRAGGGGTAGSNGAGGGLDGLGRFLAPRRGSTPAGYGPPLVMPGLKRFLEPKKRAIPGERCEFCTEDLRDEHSHVVNVETRSLMCSCRGCWMLFSPDGAAGGRYRAVPDDTILDPDFALTEGQWESLQIPVGMAFFFRQTDAPPSTEHHPVAFYPSPAGATESLLPLDVWDELVAANPTLGRMLPDVQALLVHRPRDGAPRHFIVPIDACYQLVGVIRRYWKGFDGGAEAHAAIDAFFARLAGRSRPPAVGSRS